MSPATISPSSISPADYLATLAPTLKDLIASGQTPADVMRREGHYTADRHVVENSPDLWSWTIPEGFHAPRIMELARLGGAALANQRRTVYRAVAGPQAASRPPSRRFRRRASRSGATSRAAAARHPSRVSNSLGLPSRRMVSQTFASWNLTGQFVHQLDALKRAA